MRKPVSVPARTPRELLQPLIEFDEIRVKTSEDLGDSGQPGVRYILRWEALPAHHDRPREPPLPPASTLEWVKLERS